MGEYEDYGERLGIVYFLNRLLQSVSMVFAIEPTRICSQNYLERLSSWYLTRFKLILTNIKTRLKRSNDRVLIDMSCVL